MVVIGVIGLLLAILLPALGSARESARRTSCMNNLRQAGAAVANFSEAYGAFPTGRQSGLSGPALLLPYLEHRELFELLIKGQRGGTPLISSLCCPSDPEIWANNSAGEGDSSYLFCNGTKFPTNPLLEGLNGFVSNGLKHTRPSDITDGLSNTVAMSERRSLPRDYQTDVPVDSPQAVQYLWWTDNRFHLPGQEDNAAQQAKSNRRTNSPRLWTTLCASYVPFVQYDHILPPNVPGSHNGPEDMDSTRYSYVSLVPASSLHKGGINSLFVDGSVRFHSSDVDLSVWRALGSRNGGETY
ncbi:MAG: DUF1559 domain-containing protein [Planctomycetaceae bacterium]